MVRKVSDKTLGLILRGYLYDKVIEVIQNGVAAAGLVAKLPPTVTPAPTREWFGRPTTDR